MTPCWRGDRWCFTQTAQPLVEIPRTRLFLGNCVSPLYGLFLGCFGVAPCQLGAAASGISCLVVRFLPQAPRCSSLLAAFWGILGLCAWGMPWRVHAMPCPPPRLAESVGGTVALLELSPSEPCAERVPSTIEADIREGVQFYQKGEISSAIEALEKARKNNPTRPLLRYYLARAYLRMAEQYAKQGDAPQQRRFYQRALKEDPRLLEDPQFVAHYKQLQTHDLAKPSAPLLLTRKQRVWNLGAGLSAGIEGLGGIQVSLLLWGLINPVVTFAPLSPSLDISFRVIPLRSFAWSPYIGGGMMMPLKGWTGVLSASFPEPVLHFDLGVHFLAENSFSFTAGISFVYNFDPKTTLPFLPLPTLNFFWYF
ncbi:hypothetical protein L6R29_10255 [Myxococcota bacterium]|nr:hypothetical protein [Myxococcota bacterium]